MEIVKFNFLDIRFAVQAYGKGIANIIQIDENKGTSKGSFHVDFETKKVSNSSFQTQSWKELSKRISENSEQLHSILKDIFNHA